MGDCCHHHEDLEKVYREKRLVLWIVLLINAVMFVIEFVAGFRVNSVSLVGDSLDMLGDTLAYGSTLYVLRLSKKTQAKAAFGKGIIMFLTAIIVLARVFYQLLFGIIPETKFMSLIALLALGANYLCLVLLTKYRKDNINMSSVWLCSRNDIIANILVLITAGLVAVTNSLIPDIITGLIITIIFTKSASKVLFQSLRQLY